MTTASERKILCTSCFDKHYAGYRFAAYPESVCAECGRMCLGYEPRGGHAESCSVCEDAEKQQQPKIVVPEGMRRAAEYLRDVNGVSWEDYSIEGILEAARRGLSKNPIVPTDEQVSDIKHKLVPVHPHWANIVAEWQRRMFLAPEPEVPEEVEDLLWYANTDVSKDHDAKVIEAYRRGQQSSESSK